MTPEVARWRKFAELMAYHVFRYVDWYELVAVMDGKGMAYEIRRNHRTTRPGFDDRFLTRIVLRLDFIV